MAYKPTFSAADYEHEPAGHGLSRTSKRVGKKAKSKALKKSLSQLARETDPESRSYERYAVGAMKSGNAKIPEGWSIRKQKSYAKLMEKFHKSK